MDFSFLCNEAFLQCRRAKDSYFFSSLSLPVLSWTEVLDELERHLVDGLSYEPKNNLRFILFDMIHPIVLKFIAEYSKLDQTKMCGAHCYINLMSKSGENGNHKDSADVLFWQICGSTNWKIDNVDRSSYTLCPGDAVYVPAGMYHSVTSLTPRAGISFGLDHV